MLGVTYNNNTPLKIDGWLKDTIDNSKSVEKGLEKKRCAPEKQTDNKPVILTNQNPLPGNNKNDQPDKI